MSYFFTRSVAPHFMLIVRGVLLSTVLLLCLLPQLLLAATLAVSPATGVYKTGGTFTVTVFVNTAGKSINAADGTLSFNPRELSVVSVGRGASIFNLWTAEPTFSNAAGTVTFSGGLPSGYTGAGGNVFSVTFKSLTSGTARVSLSGASVLAADGRGTNVLTGMSGGTYTLAAVESQPAPEVIVEYVAPANTPAAPKVSSPTHGDQTVWHTEKTATLNWSLPTGVTGVRTLLDESSVSVPTKVYENPITTITLTDLDEGISYFHVQLRNGDGWGKVAHYRLAIDSEKPESFTIALPDQADLSNPNQALLLQVKDATSPVTKFKVQLDGAEPYEFIATSSSSTLPLSSLSPGYHTVVIEAFDAAGNALIGSFSFTILSFDKPVFTDYPATLSAGVIPVLRGTTRPNALLKVALTTPGGEVMHQEVTSTADGSFTFIPESAFSVGVYAVTAVAIDQYGAQSESSDEIKMVVQQPGYLVIGSFLINVLSVIVPLIALCVLTWLLVIYSFRRIRTLRTSVARESGEASAMLVAEFAHIRSVLAAQEEQLMNARKTKKLTIGETTLLAEIRTALREAEGRVAKEVSDVADVVRTK